MELIGASRSGEVAEVERAPTSDTALARPAERTSPETNGSEPADAPTPGRSVSIGVLILATLAVIFTLYVGSDVVLPIVLALVLKLMFQPVMNFLCNRLYVPPVVAAAFLIVCVFGATAAVALTISAPASVWVRKIPEILPDVKQKLEGLRQPIEYMQRAFTEIQSLTSSAGQGPAGETAVSVKETSSGMASALALGTAAVLARFLATMVVLFFLLAAGDRLLRGLIEVLPRFSDKRQAVCIATEIQHQIGGYLLTITAMNTLVGIATGLAMQWCGLGDAILWGAMAFLLNYVPVLGPLTGVGIFLVAGIVTLEWPWSALLPAGLYLLIHIAEGEIVTPMLLAKRFQLNPALVIISLLFWHALWGIPGALLAVPLLATFKIIADHVEPLKPVAHIMGA